MWITVANTIPPTSTFSNVTFMISAPQPDSNHLYFHIRTRDGGWVTGTLARSHLGPFYNRHHTPTTPMSSPGDREQFALRLQTGRGRTPVRALPSMTFSFRM